MNCKWVSRKDKNLKCNRHADSSGYCLFHKQNKSKREIALFDAYIKKGQISNFTGFYFEDKFEIKKLINYKYEKLKFCEAVFKEEADFSLNISNTNNGFVGNNRESASKLKEAINKLNHVK